MLEWTPLFIVAVFAVVALHGLVQRRRIDREWMDADIERIHSTCEIVTGPDGVEYAVLKPEFRPSATEAAHDA